MTGVMAKLNKIKAGWLLWPCPHIERIICDRRASSKLKKCLIIVEVSCPDIDFIPGARSGGSKRASTLRRSSRVGAGGGKTGRKKTGRKQFAVAISAHTHTHKHRFTHALTHPHKFLPKPFHPNLSIYSTRLL